MSFNDRARLEEIRFYTLEILSKSFFELHSEHIGRVCNLVLSLSCGEAAKPKEFIELLLELGYENAYPDRDYKEMLVDLWDADGE